MTITLIVLAIYLTLVFVIGSLAGKRTLKGEEEFYTGDREFGFWPTTMSACATDSSGWVFIGACGAGYLSGICILWMIPGFVIGYGLNWFLIAPKLRRQAKKIKALSVVDFLSKRLDQDKQLVRALSSVIVVLFFVPYMASQLIAAGKTMNTVIGFDYKACLIFSAVFVVGYCFFGGYRSVIWTDTIQGTLMLLVLGVFPIYLVLHLGGWSVFWNKVCSIEPLLISPGGGAAGMALLGLIAGYIFYGVGIIGQPHILQRFLTVRDHKSLRRGSIVATIWFNVMMIGSSIVGLAGRIMLPGIADPEYVFPTMVLELFHPVIAGVVIGGIFAAIQSTFSSQLLVAVQSVASDLPRCFGKTDINNKQAIKMARITMATLGLIAIGLALLNFETVFLLVIFAWSCLAAAFGPLLVALLLYPSKVNLYGAVAGIVAGAVVTSVWYAAGWGAFLCETFPGILTSAVIIFVVSMITKNSAPMLQRL